MYACKCLEQHSNHLFDFYELMIRMSLRIVKQLKVKEKLDFYVLKIINTENMIENIFVRYICFIAFLPG